MVASPPDNPVLAELTRSVVALSGSQSDGLRSIADMQKSLSVALDKLNALESFASQLEERTKRLDATHYSYTDEMHKDVQELLKHYKKIHLNLLSIENNILSPESLSILFQQALNASDLAAAEVDAAKVDELNQRLTALDLTIARVMIVPKWLWVIIATGILAVLAVVAPEVMGSILRLLFKP